MLTDIDAPGEESNVDKQHGDSGSLTGFVVVPTVFGNHGCVNSQRNNDSSLRGSADARTHFLDEIYETDHVSLPSAEEIQDKTTETVADCSESHETGQDQKRAGTVNAHAFK